MKDKYKPIGVFDSGAGGLTVVSRLLERMPQEKLVYFGDTARVPYGSKSPEAITRFSLEITDFLLGKGVKAIVVACNSTTATCLDKVSKRAGIPVFGVIAPAADALAEYELEINKKIKRVGVIATERTVKSGKYEEILKEKAPHAEIISKACPLFVPLAEEGLLEGEITKAAVSHYITEFIEKGAEALLLGCTHYPLLMGEINKLCGNKMKIIDPAVKLAESVKTYLDNNGILADTAEPENPDFYLSGASEAFKAVCAAALGRKYQCAPEIVSVSEK